LEEKTTTYNYLQLGDKNQFSYQCSEETETNHGIFEKNNFFIIINMSEQVFIEFHTRWFYIPTIITVAFLFAYVGIKDCYKKIREFVNVLDDDQKIVYNEIRKERETTYWSAFMQGCFIAILYLLLTVFTCGHSKSVYNLVSDVLCIILVTTYFVYTLKEKKKIMLLDGDMDETQERKWIAIYRCMQKSFWSWFLMGLLISGFVFSLLDAISPPIRICVQPSIAKKKPSLKRKQKK
jgi:hypothetical protein